MDMEGLMIKLFRFQTVTNGEETATYYVVSDSWQSALSQVEDAVQDLPCDVVGCQVVAQELLNDDAILISNTA